METTLFELPKIARYARARFTAEEVDQIAIVEGDMLKDAIPGGYDAIILANVLHVFSIGQNRALLKRLRDAAQAGCRLLLVDFFLDETCTQPVAAALMSGEFLTHANGRSYSAAEISALAAETGWRVVDQRPLAGPVSLLVVE